ncbi:hypothetical protein TNIN_402521 [Trichonephila inaurata madagascariensis]|uniref:Uncharacterized protein n=1 Tax=Trichonephila inaurata madagascariensis TaxID=2747483 RepID=A0A8X6YUF9_9ARAC|nr:hypothetical protein TNIN_402521 [Trichonephila inaurata madagascariensis]
MDVFWIDVLDDYPVENGSHDQKRIGRIWRHGILKNDFTLKPGYDSLNPPQRTHAKTRVHPQNMVFPPSFPSFIVGVETSVLGTTNSCIPFVPNNFICFRYFKCWLVVIFCHKSQMWTY